MSSDQSGTPAVNANVYTMNPMSRPTKKSRGIRVIDVVWDGAKAEADRRGEYLNEAIDRFLIAYAQGGDTSPAKPRR